MKETSNKHTMDDLHMMQAAPLSVKIRMTERRIRDWVDEYGINGVYVSFSGGKDSTVLLHIARNIYPEMKAAFVDTGLEYPEIRQFVKKFDNVDWIKPELTFRQVLEKYGYPFISKEVSECVDGARKYLTYIAERESLDRQTDRQTALRMHNSIVRSAESENTRKTPYQSSTTNYADSASMQHPTGGGYDNKYRKLRGLGEYSRKGYREHEKRWESFPSCATSRNGGEREPDRGEYP